MCVESTKYILVDGGSMVRSIKQRKHAGVGHDSTVTRSLFTSDVKTAVGCVVEGA